MNIISTCNNLYLAISGIVRKNLKSLIMFLIVGLPSFVIAIVLNYFLVNSLNWPMPVAYAVVLVIQVTINYFMCRQFVFKNESTKSVLVQLLQYISGIGAFRFFDWLLYSILTQILPIHFVIIQVGNVIIFSLLKYRFAKRVIEGK